MKHRTSRQSSSSATSSGPSSTEVQSFFADRYSNATSFHSEVRGEVDIDAERKDRFSYAILIALYTLQGIPIGLSASIPFLIQQKVKLLTAAVPLAEGMAEATTHAISSTHAARLSYNANAVFALCSWPFSLKLLWAPIVDACYLKSFGRRKSWLVPVQAVAGLLMVFGSSFVERQLGLGDRMVDLNVGGVTAYFFALFFLMATQDIAVDGWALTMLSKKNRKRGPVCNSIGQNIGYFLSFVGFLSLNDIESSERIWRPLLRIPSNPEKGLVSLGAFIRFMGFLTLAITSAVGLFKREVPRETGKKDRSMGGFMVDQEVVADDDEHDLDASEIGLMETYHRLWAVCKLPAVRWLFVILLTHRLPMAMGDNVKFLKAVEYGLSKSTAAFLSPAIVLPMGILVPLLASRYWNVHPLKQFMTGYRIRVTLVPILNLLMLQSIKHGMNGSMGLWSLIIVSTALQAMMNSLQFNAQMMFFASRVDPAIGGSYMTLLNTVNNLGGTWPASFVLSLMSLLGKDGDCSVGPDGVETCVGGRDPYVLLQVILSSLGVLWLFLLGGRVRQIAELPDDAWRTHILDNPIARDSLDSVDVELAGASFQNRWTPKMEDKQR